MGFILGLFVGSAISILFCYSAFTDEYVEDEKELWSKE